MIHGLEEPLVASLDAGVRAILQSRKLPRCRKMKFGRAELQKFEHRWRFTYWFEAVHDWDAVAGTMVDANLPEIAPVSFFLPMEKPADWIHKAADVVEMHIKAAIAHVPYSWVMYPNPPEQVPAPPVPKYVQKVLKKSADKRARSA